MCDIEEAALAEVVAGLKRATNADIDGVRSDVSLKAELAWAAEATLARWSGRYSLCGAVRNGRPSPIGLPPWSGPPTCSRS